MTKIVEIILKIIVAISATLIFTPVVIIVSIIFSLVYAVRIAALNMKIVLVDVAKDAIKMSAPETRDDYVNKLRKELDKRNR